LYIFLHGRQNKPTKLDSNSRRRVEKHGHMYLPLAVTRNA
jgi:hypothetical protein